MTKKIEKIAIVHDWFVDWAGSERVVEQILQCFPSADLFALVDFLPADVRARIQGKQATTTFLQKLPFARSRLHWYLPLMPLAIEQLNVAGYDLVISSSHAAAKGVITAPDQLHISYVHSPMRYAWDLQFDYLRSTSMVSPLGFATRLLLHYLRLWDSRTPNGVDAFVANSRFIAKRIWKTYRRNAEVIHPPVEIERFAMKEAKDDFFLCLSRLMPYKRVDAVVDAFRQLPDKRLVVIGDGPERKRIARHTPANVELLGYRSDTVVCDYLQRARALVFAAKEDFGITIVEALACGTPVIAYGAGGALETVTGIGAAAPTGVFFHEQTAQAIADAIRAFEANRHSITAQACRRSAEQFSPARFRAQFSAFVATAIANAAGADSRRSNDLAAIGADDPSQDVDVVRLGSARIGRD